MYTLLESFGERLNMKTLLSVFAVILGMSVFAMSFSLTVSMIIIWAGSSPAGRFADVNVSLVFAAGIMSTAAGGGASYALSQAAHHAVVVCTASLFFLAILFTPVAIWG